MAATTWERQLRAVEKYRKPDKRMEICRSKQRTRKPPWDDTRSDLSVYKPTVAELERRHQLHKPKPLSERKYLQQFQDLLLRENKENLITRKTIYKDHVEKQKALIKETFSNQEMELSHVLAETDRAIANVKDLFGDDPMKFKAIPHITDAPHSASRINGSVLAIDVKTPSRLTALSDSVMRHPALNDITDYQSDQASNHSGESGSDEFDKDDKRTGFSYQSNFDFDYYNKLLQMEESREELGKNRTGASNFSSQEIVRDDIEEAAADIINEKALAHDMDKTAEECDLKANMNEQTKILRNSMNSGSSEKSEIQLERQIPDHFRVADGPLEKFDRMRKEIQMIFDQEENASSAAHVQSLITFIRELSGQLELERESREHLGNEFQEQRALIDALTGDLIYSQEENEKLRAEFERFKAEIKSEIAELRNDFQLLYTNHVS